MTNAALRIAVGIATAGRREQMSNTLEQLRALRPLPDRLLLCPATERDLPDDAIVGFPCPVLVVSSERGLCAQRNAIIRNCSDIDVIIFFDDDYYPAPDYIACVRQLFGEKPSIVIATNLPDRDGAVGPGISHEEALKVLATIPRSQADAAGRMKETYGGYGCNMSLRMGPIKENRLQFDEALPLYGWLEDIDFSRRMAPYGDIVMFDKFHGVHLGTKRGRVSGLRVGYSQIANPVYLVRKGSMSLRYASKHMIKNILMNLFRFALPEPWVDRRGRLRGNLAAVVDALKGRIHPTKILSMH